MTARLPPEVRADAATTPDDEVSIIARLRAEGASTVTVRTSRGGTREIIATWPEAQQPQRPAIRPR